MFTHKKEVKMKRREFLKSIAAASVVCSVTQAFADKGETKMPSIRTPSSENQHCLVEIGWDNRPHYPVWANSEGEMNWEKKSFYDIVTDINRGVAEVQKRSYGLFIPSKHSFWIGIPPSRTKCLQKNNVYELTVEKYIKACWPKAEIWNHRIAASFLEYSGFKSSAEFFVMWNFEFNDNGEPLNCFAFSQYGI